MIIKKEGYVEDKIARACYRIADYLKLSIKEKEDKFTIKESLEDEDIWFDKNSLTTDDFVSFMEMARGYTPCKEIRVPTASYVYKIDCPFCHRCIMTKQQLELNTIIIDGKSYVVCISCGEIMEIPELLEED